MLKFRAKTGNNLRIINCIKLLSRNLNSMGLKISVEKFQLPLPLPHGEKAFILVTSPSVEKWLSLVPNTSITLTATATKH